MRYKKRNKRNQYILIGLLVVSIILTTLYYREPDEGPFNVSKRLTLSMVSSVQAGATIISRPVVNGWDYFDGMIKARGENVKLRDELAELKRKVETYELTEEENQRLKELLKTSQRENFETKLVNIIGYSSTDLERIIVIDKGLNDGLKKRMPVITNRGLVGQIVEITGKAAKVQLIIDNRSGVAVKTMKEDVKGVIEGTSKGLLTMNMVDKKANIKEGDGVFTSGLGGVFPKGIYVGNVERVRMSADKLFRDIRIKSSIEFGKLKQVLIVISPLPPDITELMR